MAFAFPVESEEEVKEKITDLKKKYFDARHHCFAYIQRTLIFSDQNVNKLKRNKNWVNPKT